MENDQLTSVAKLAAEQLVAEEKVAKLESELKAAKAALAHIQTNLLPSTMMTLGLLDYTLLDGSKVAVREHFRCPQLDDGPDDEKGEKRPLSERLEALGWLEGAGHGDLAKRVVTVTLGADANELADELITLLRSHRAGNKLLIDQRRTVPWNRLAAFAREQLGQGEDIPLDVLGVSVQRSSKITQAKE
jgi:hypothetical protein